MTKEEQANKELGDKIEKKLQVCFDDLREILPERAVVNLSVVFPVRESDGRMIHVGSSNLLACAAASQALTNQLLTRVSQDISEDQ